jgi:hypothetical protein
MMCLGGGGEEGERSDQQLSRHRSIPRFGDGSLNGDANL